VIYRKRGRTIRWENGARIDVEESGWAREQGSFFECAPLDEGPPEGLPAVSEETPVLPALPADVCVERFFALRGVAVHEYDETHWSEVLDRVHLSLTCRGRRVLLDTTSDRMVEVAEVADALGRSELVERPAPARLRLAPRITAALLPLLTAVAPPNVSIVQTPGRIDGYGHPVEENGIHFYRPSYRLRPVRMPFDLRLECHVTRIEADRPIAIAALEPVTSLAFAVLIRDGDRVYPSRLRLTRIDAVSETAVWYPYGAGSFGAELML
jgi:hypothetical protein